MTTTILDLLSRIGTVALVLSVSAFVLINGIALVVFVRTQDRTLVNRWTGRILAANLMLAGTGIGVPLLTGMARLAVSTFSSSVQPQIGGKNAELEPTQIAPPGR